MDVDFGYLTKGLTKRSLMGQCGGALTSKESQVNDYPYNMVNDNSTSQLKDEMTTYDTKKVGGTSSCSN